MWEGREKWLFGDASRGACCQSLIRLCHAHAHARPFGVIRATVYHTGACFPAETTATPLSTLHCSVFSTRQYCTRYTDTAPWCITTCSALKRPFKANAIPRQVSLNEVGKVHQDLLWSCRQPLSLGVTYDLRSSSALLFSLATFSLSLPQHQGIAKVHDTMSDHDDAAEAKGGYDWMDRERFLKHYELKLAYEFSHDGEAAEWAQNGHRFWDQADGVLKLEEGDPDKSGHGFAESNAALSPDNRFLAVSTNAVIRLYDVRSKEMVSELKAHDEHVEHLYFGPLPAPTAQGGGGTGYTLVSSGLHDYTARGGRIFIWNLDDDGKLCGRDRDDIPDNFMRAMTNRAMKVVSRDLKHYCGMDEHDLTETQRSMIETLQKSVRQSRVKKLPLLRAELPPFGFANPISRDGKHLITLEQNETTQHGMRPLDEMPRIVVRNLTTLQEEWRLTGHQDAIMWAGWSPDDKHVAEASWDETFGIWNPKVVDRAEGHLIGPSGGQNWVGDFSADGKYIVFSGGSPTKVAVYEVATGAQVAVLKHPEVEKDWVRELKWSPIDYTIAVVVRQEVVIWCPIDGNSFTSVLKIETDGTLLTSYNSLRLVKWVDEGQKLIVRDTANTVFVWDIRMNKKWRFQRPDKLALETSPSEVFFVKRLAKEGALLSLDGDRRVRYWNL